ncbi:MAG TPA: rhodanese-like domain-containing protein [Syntrophorhabdales bacterium]|nr:rhodanese-like domain-containing protein [Syntrophorhabdales bacterium]
MVTKRVKYSCRTLIIATLLAVTICFITSPAVRATESDQKAKATAEAVQFGPAISTEEVQQIIAGKRAPLLDVRSEKEYAIAHIPGSINIYEGEIDTISGRFPDKKGELVLYCNGPYCHKVKRVGEQLIKRGYTNFKRYQAGLPVWRAFGNTVQTDMLGFRYIFSGDKTAVFVDARSSEEFKAGTVPGAVNVQAGETEKANTDGRLPYTDKGTRIIVFADRPERARIVAEEIAHTAFWNSSYFGGTFDELKQARLW